MGKLDGKTAVITGGSSGMALASASDDSSFVNGMELSVDGGTSVI